MRAPLRMICLLAPALVAGAEPPAPVRLQGNPPLARTRAYLSAKLQETESLHDVKCWTTFKRIEDIAAGRPLEPEAAQVRAELVQKFAADAWLMAQALEPRGSRLITAKSLEIALQHCFSAKQSRHGMSGTVDVLVSGEPVGNATLILDEALFAQTADGWRALLSVLQHDDGAFLLDLSPEATQALGRAATIYSLAVLKLADRLAQDSKSNKISGAFLETADRIIRIPRMVDSVPVRPVAPGSRSRRYAAALGILYASDKIRSLEKVNGKADDALRRKTLGDIAGLPVDVSAVAELHRSLVPDLAREIWLRAQSKLGPYAYMISGDDMYRAIAELYPYVADAQENITFFPDSKDRQVILAHWADAYRDDTIHWKNILDILVREVDADDPSPSRLHASLDPYAGEELSEALSDLPVLLIRLAARQAGAQRRDRIDAGMLDQALTELRRLSRASRAAPRPAAPPAETARPAKDPLFAATSGTLFVDVTAMTGIGTSYRSRDKDRTEMPMVQKRHMGVAIEDYDKDGKPDLFLCGENAGLYRNSGGMRFEDVTAKAGLAGVRRGRPRAASFADYDNDGRPDLFVTYFGRRPPQLFHNNGDGTFTDVTRSSGLRFRSAKSMGIWLDYDGDGYLDLYLAYGGRGVPTVGDATNAVPNALWRNNGDGTFTAVTEEAGVGDPRWALAATAVDYNDDGLPDIFVNNDFGRSTLYKNLGGGRFEDVTDAAGLSALGHGMGVSVGDFAHDGRPGLYVTNIGVYNQATRYIRPNSRTPIQTSETLDRTARAREANHLYRNNGDGTFTDVVDAMMEPIKTGWGWNGFFFDFDNDGYLDLHVSDGFLPFVQYHHDERQILIHYDPEARLFRDVSSISGVDFPGNSRGGAYADLDGDGFLDLVVVGLHPAKIFRNASAGNGNHWLGLRLEGTRSNRDAVGAKVTIRAGDLTQTDWVGSQGGHLDSECPKELHFGLGRRRAVDEIRIRWPSGQTQIVKAVPADQRIVIAEPGKSRWSP